MRCIIIDDEPDAIKAVKKCINKTPELFLTFSTTNPLEGIIYLKNNEVDFVFLDINMEEMNGMNVAKIIPHKIIITTAHPQHALESYGYLNIVDYLVKPIEQERFDRSINKMRAILNKKDSNENMSTIKTSKGIIKLDFQSIEYIKADRAICLINGKDAIPISLGELLAVLPNHIFKRLHKSYVVNLSKVFSFRHNKVILLSNATIPIGRAYR